MQSTDQSRKRRRVSDGSVSEDGVLSSGQTRESVAGTPDGQHASRGVKSPNEATGSEFDFFFNLANLLLLTLAWAR